jgi:hypothetical protein
MARQHYDTKCKCGKFGHISKPQATKAARRVTNSHSDFTVYACKRFYGYWHWSSRVREPNIQIGLFEPGPVRVKRLEFFPGEPWVVISRDGVIVTSFPAWQNALEKAISVAKNRG